MSEASPTRVASTRSASGEDVAGAEDRAAAMPSGWRAALTSPLRCLPDFLILGAQKSGTTSLYEHLRRLPGIWMPPSKECHYFDARIRLPWMYRRRFLTRAARRRLERVRGGPVRLGEATPYYLFHPAVPTRVARLLPQTRFIVLLRNPVERAYSHYRHARRLGLENLSFEQALDAEPSRLRGEHGRLMGSFAASRAHQHHSYVSRGRYAEQLQRWFRAFDRARFEILIAEELFQHPADALARIAAHLEIPAPSEQTYPVRNVGTPDAMNPDLRSRLVATFREPNAALEALLGRPLPWSSG